MDGTAKFLEVFSKWRKNVGAVLAGEDPQMLVRIVELSSTMEGISQRALLKYLQINQPRLSKLTKKLVVCRWVELQKSSTDRRMVLMNATDLAKAKVEWLRTELSAIEVMPALAAPKRGRRLKLPAGQTSLL